jgi:hypothetical protein
MGLFRRVPRSSGWDDDVPGLAALANARGWERTDALPVDQRLTDLLHRSLWTLYDRPFTRLTLGGAGVDSGTSFNNVYHATDDAQPLVVANGWANIGPTKDMRLHEMRGVAVCAVELTSLSPVFVVQPRSLPPVDRYPTVLTGDADFDDRFLVAMVAGLDPAALADDVRRRIATHDDWLLVGHDRWLACVSRGAFESADEVSGRVDEMLSMVAAFPTSVLPTQVDHSVDDLARRIRSLHSAEDAITFIAQLSADDRDRLARSGTPLAAFSDVASRDEAIARFGELDTAQRMQLLAMFQRRNDNDAPS